MIMGSFGRLEEQQIHQNAQQAIRLLADEVAKLESTLMDWANWDDTYQFVAGANDGYIENNLNESSIVNLNLNFMFFTNIAGQIVHSVGVDPESGRIGPVSSALRDHIQNNAILSRIEKGTVTAGVVLLPDNPVLIASAPILNSLEEGPARGRMIIGRYFNASEINRIAEKLQLSLSLHRFGDQRLPETLKNVAHRFGEGEQTVINVVNNDLIEIFFLIKDIYNQPVLFMGIDKSRVIFVQGRNTLKYFTCFLLGIGGAFMVVVFVLIEKVVLLRLRRTSRQVNAIEIHGDFETRVALAGNDELTQLVVDINKMLDALQHNTERDRNILDNIIDGYCETDLQGRILLTNPALRRMTAFTEDELLNKAIDDLIDPQDMSRIRQDIRTSIANKEPIRRMGGKLCTKRDQTGYFDATVNLITDSQGNPLGYRSIIRDVTKLKQNEERLVYLAYHDPLTGLYNRKAFMERLEEEIAYATRYKQERALLFVDLDKFKEVNDTFGHDTGDRLLAMVAERMRSELRETDVVARMGGDEFTILLTNPERSSPCAVVERIAMALSQPFDISGQGIDFVSASVGAKCFPADAETAEKLVKAADSDMYKVKNKRKHSRICAMIKEHQQAEVA
jgi:diguanylate cyclase (GGDEF)-like protein/PAS domain S-box-containing protein